MLLMTNIAFWPSGVAPTPFRMNFDVDVAVNLG
jgi:hypothetical protein